MGLLALVAGKRRYGEQHEYGNEGARAADSKKHVATPAQCWVYQPRHTGLVPR